MTQASLAGHFIDGSNGRIFVLTRMPARPRGCVLVVPPFAEEMNKSRRMVTEVSLRLAERGIGTVFPDLYGTGDSEGDLSEVGWNDWLMDLGATCQWAGQQGTLVDRLLAVRLGCALAVRAASGKIIGPFERTALWQPVFDGGRFLTQFLRLRTAASLMEDRKETVAGLRDQLKAGSAIEVAGYPLTGQLADDLDAIATPSQLPVGLGAIAWMEVAREAGTDLPIPSRKLIDGTHSAGQQVTVGSYAGEPFWASTEIVRNTAMIDATVLHFAGCVAGA